VELETKMAVCSPLVEDQLCRMNSGLMGVSSNGVLRFLINSQPRLHAQCSSKTGVHSNPARTFKIRVTLISHYIQAHTTSITGD
jgi:hypothetical protein